MFLLILDKNPYKSVELIPDRLKFKQLLELGQLICSAGISDVYRPVNQGKKLQAWIKENVYFTFCMYDSLMTWCVRNINLKTKTLKDFCNIRDGLYCFLTRAKRSSKVTTNGIFRYIKEYKPFTRYNTNTQLPIEECVKEYKKYINWKEEMYKRRIK